jgi:hypothetical protein
MKFFPTIIAANIALFAAGAGHVAASPRGEFPPLVAEMARADWKPSYDYAPHKPRLPRPDWIRRSDFPPLVAEMRQRDWHPEVTCGYSIRGHSTPC